MRECLGFPPSPVVSRGVPHLFRRFSVVSAITSGVFSFSELERQDDPTLVKDRRREQVDDVFSPPRAMIPWLPTLKMAVGLFTFLFFSLPWLYFEDRCDLQSEK